ncbi:MAG: DUF6178 family protein, partial [Pseudomonadales bacterium]
MPSPTVPRSNANARALMETMTASAALPAFVKRIDPHTLKHLVDDVGLEDAGPLIEHVSHTQLVHLLDETLWTGARPGDPDQLSVAELLRWLEVWNGLGSGFVADKLYELGDEFCALTFSRLLVIVDFDMAPRLLDEHTLAVGRYIVRVRIDDEWDVVKDSVTALWRDYPDYCEAVFARLAYRHSVLKLFGEDDTAGLLDADAGYAHEQGREEAGYVTSVMAGTFLRNLTDADVDALAAERAYDLQTTEYFRRRSQLQREGSPAGGMQTVWQNLHADASDGEPADDAPEGQAPAGADDGAPSRDLAALEAELASYERAQLRPAALLTGPETTKVRES